MKRPVAIEVQHLHKEFHIPGRGQVSARQRMVNPLKRSRGRQLRVLDDVSFEVGKGEFFGIVGRNGSGKSTLLKLLASIYRADGGSIRIGGRLAPFIELGVGFNTDLAAYDNVVLNGVMMGLTPREARRRSQEIVEFAGLEGFTDLKLRNYSSGMRVRLGFSVMAHVDADVLLIDEVLAVGDAAFQERCGEVFGQMHQQGRTIVLVTHSMPSINLYCDRALLLHDGNIETIGEPEAVANRYLELNHAEVLTWASGDGQVASEAPPDGRPASVVDVRLGEDGETDSPTVAEGAMLELRATLEVGPGVGRPGFGFTIYDQTGRLLFVSPAREFDASGSSLERVHVSATIENRLAAGQYLLSCGVLDVGAESAFASDSWASTAKWVSFQVLGDGHRSNLVSLAHDVRFERTVAEEAPAT